MKTFDSPQFPEDDSLLTKVNACRQRMLAVAQTPREKFIAERILAGIDFDEIARELGEKAT